jgi:Na+-translocating ferredoxin:NAD+ oxidoreductase RnfG subunit
MTTGRLMSGLVLMILLAIGEIGLAHITPPVVLVSDQDAVLGMMSGAKKFFVREVRLTPEERDAIQKQWGWRPEGDLYRAFLGRDDAGKLVAAVMFLTEYTIHGPVRVAVGLGPDGRIKGAQVVELTEETYPWLKPLIDQDFTRDYVGRDSRANFGLSERLMRMRLDSMPEFYAQVVASLIQRAAVLFDVAVLKRDGKI